MGQHPPKKEKYGDIEGQIEILKKRMLNLRNYFVIFCNFPIDEMTIMGYNACMKKMLAQEQPAGVPE